jgi:hypothetical protein
MHYTAGELKDLLMYALQKYEEDLEITPEATSIINNWVMTKGDEIIESHYYYLQYLGEQADRAKGIEQGYDNNRY